jgi:hypothetical protein
MKDYIINDKGFCEQLASSQLYKSLLAVQLKNASQSARYKIALKLKEYTLFERLHKTFLYDEEFIGGLIKNCTSTERAFIVLQLNRLCLFDGSVDIDYCINKNLSEKKMQNAKSSVIIGFARYNESLIEDIFKSTNGILEVELKQYFYGLSDDELKETAVVLLKFINEHIDLETNYFPTPKQFRNRMKDLCVIRAFINASQTKIEKDYLVNNYSSEH